MKRTVFALLMAVGLQANAEGSVCMIAEIINNIPYYSESKPVPNDQPLQLATTNGEFTGEVFYQEEFKGYSITLKHGDATASGFIDGSPETPLISLHNGERQAQINCWFN